MVSGKSPCFKGHFLPRLLGFGVKIRRFDSHSRFGLGLVAFVAVAVVLGGCSTVEPVASPAPTASASPVPESRPDPVSAFAIDCLELGSLAGIAANDGYFAAPLSDARASATYSGFPGATLLADGALSCVWLSGEHEGLWVPLVSVVALPDADEMYSRVKPFLVDRPYPYTDTFSAFDNFDRTIIQCHEKGELIGMECTWHVLAGDVWLEIVLSRVEASDYRLPSPATYPDNHPKPLKPVVEGSKSLPLVTSIVNAVTNAPRVPVDHVMADFPPCTSLIDMDSIAGLSNEPLNTAPDETPPEQKPIPNAIYLYEFSAERLGFRNVCNVSTLADWSLSFRVTKGLDWVLEPPFSVPDGSVDVVDGLGTTYTYCYADEGGIGCEVTVVSDDIILSMNLRSSHDVSIATIIGAEILDSLGK